MASQVTNPPKGGGDGAGGGGGPSYARVLKFKTTEFNKENIAADPELPPTQAADVGEGWEIQTTKGKQRGATGDAKCAVAAGQSSTVSEFPSISGPSKGSKAAHGPAKDANGKGAPPAVRKEQVPPAAGNGRPKTAEPAGKEKSEGDAAAQQGPKAKVRFVEAPLPKVNPWAVKSAASVIKGPPADPPAAAAPPAQPVAPDSPAAAFGSGPSPPVVHEKRVLQPHTTGEYRIVGYEMTRIGFRYIHTSKHKG
ncbi:Hypothetical protein NTJ_03813 [Nesidiocoris tenuis]|uniref:Uncharacterized protein n=1 Tax=Nesidiocoris tenuis TaxID=355587 RepID=A0ABN7AJE9_9HEMI|nr:Hypothetical protein NTJ_03813 [Nesidiocoris tenuis]